MTSETRPTCVYALAGLKRNETRLMIVMCVGIALALYGVYIQARSQSNPSYMPTISVATSWLYESLGHRLNHPTSMFASCQGKQAKTTVPASFGHFLLHKLIEPVTHYSGIINGTINVIQIAILKVYSKSLTGTDAIIGLSSFGMVVSMICLLGSFASCKLMCISCLGIHHIVIIYLAIRRRRMLKNILCPTANINEGACTFGSSGAGSKDASTLKTPNSIMVRHSSSCCSQIKDRRARARIVS